MFAWYRKGYIEQSLRGQGNCLISLEMRFKQVLNEGDIYMQSVSCLCGTVPGPMGPLDLEM